MSAAHDITSLAKADLLDIWHYTAQRWGVTQADHYLRKIDACFAAVAAGKITGKRPLPQHLRLRSVRCEHHYVFFLSGKRGKKPVILAILHEKMDLIARLKHRLGD